MNKLTDPHAGIYGWRDLSVGQIIDHIETAHQANFRAERPRLMALALKVARVHGPRHPELASLAAEVDRMFLDLDLHLDLEARAFFPACRNWEARGPGTAPSPELIAYSRDLEEEHLALDKILKSIRNLTSDFIPPEDACNSYLALYQGLERLEADLREWLHEENDILHARISGTVPNAHSIEPGIGSGKPKTDSAPPASCCGL